jgi:hypothetical protein
MMRLFKNATSWSKGNDVEYPRKDDICPVCFSRGNDPFSTIHGKSFNLVDSIKGIFGLG